MSTGLHAMNRAMAAWRSACYWPFQYSWLDYFDSFDTPGAGKALTVRQTLASDFARFAAAGINCVRIECFNGTASTRFGGVNSNPASAWARASATALGQLNAVVAAAGNAGLRVGLYLYDFANIYTPLEGAPWTNNTQYLSDILAPYANDSRLAYVALRNEVDLGPGNDYTKGKGTSSTVVAIGTQSISVANTSYVYAGQTVWIDDGASQETVVVAASPAPTSNGTTVTFTATFAKTHSGTYNVYLAYPTQAAATTQWDTWMAAMIDAIRTIAPSIPLTVSCSGNGSTSPSKSQYLDAGDTLNFQRMCRKIGPNSGHPVDFYEVHLYGGAQSIKGVLAKYVDASVAAGPLPIFLGEYGFSTCPDTTTNSLTGTSGVGAPNQANLEAFQDHWYRVFHAACIAYGLNPGQPWMVDDLYGAGRTDARSVASGWNSPEGISTNSGNSYSQIGSIEYYRGIWRPDGSQKPVYATLSGRYHGQAPDGSFNASFDADDGAGWPLRWQSFYPTGFTLANWTVALDTGRTGSGKSLHISGSATGVDPNYLPAVRIVLPTTWLPGESHTVTGWIKTASATGKNMISVWALDAGATQMNIGGSFKLSCPNKTGTNGWTQVSISFSVPASCSCIEVRCESSGNSGDVWFDDIAVA